MRGFKAKNLVAIVDFIYNGEANIHQEDLDGFLVLAQELPLKGLAGGEKEEKIFKENIPEHKNIETINLKLTDIHSICSNQDPHYRKQLISKML